MPFSERTRGGPLGRSRSELCGGVASGHHAEWPLECGARVPFTQFHDLMRQNGSRVAMGSPVPEERKAMRTVRPHCPPSSPPRPGCPLDGRWVVIHLSQNECIRLGLCPLCSSRDAQPGRRHRFTISTIECSVITEVQLYPAICPVTGAVIAQTDVVDVCDGECVAEERRARDRGQGNAYP